MPDARATHEMHFKPSGLETTLFYLMALLLTPHSIQKNLEAIEISMRDFDKKGIMARTQ